MPEMVTMGTPLITLEDRTEVAVAQPGWMVLITDPAIPKGTRRAYKMAAVNLAAYVQSTLGTAATHPAGDFATAAQGTKADTAVQPAALQPYATTAAVNAGDAANASAISAHAGDRGNPHQVTKAQVGLGNVDNTTDLAKPISTATATALAGKAAATQQARVTTTMAGTYTWTYPTPYAAGVVPIIEALPEWTAGSNDLVNVQLDGTPTNVACKIRVTRTQQSVASLLGLTILSVPASIGAVVVHLVARPPA